MEAEQQDSHEDENQMCQGEIDEAPELWLAVSSGSGAPGKVSRLPHGPS